MTSPLEAVAAFLRQIANLVRSSHDARVAARLTCVMQRRRTIRPRRLVHPGPSEGELNQILLAASSAPDHGGITPWRFVHIAPEGRVLLADAFEAAELERCPLARVDALQATREKAFRSPVLILVICQVTGEPEYVRSEERLISTGCAIQNVLLIATALGFGTSLTTGRSIHSTAVRDAFGVRDNELPVCFINIGTAEGMPAPMRQRPALAAYFSRFGEDPRHATSPTA